MRVSETELWVFLIGLVCQGTLYKLELMAYVDSLTNLRLLSVELWATTKKQTRNSGRRYPSCTHAFDEWKQTVDGGRPQQAFIYSTLLVDTLVRTAQTHH